MAAQNPCAPAQRAYCPAAEFSRLAAGLFCAAVADLSEKIAKTNATAKATTATALIPKSTAMIEVGDPSQTAMIATLYSTATIARIGGVHSHGFFRRSDCR
jgi:hypothetical protein